MSRGNITRRGNSWQLKFDLSAADGKRRTRYATVRGGTYKDAQREHTKLLNSADVGTLPDPSNATLAEYLRAWLDSSHERSPKTLERYRQLAERQIIPHLGANKLQKLKPEDVKRWHTTLLGQGLAPRTVGHAHRLLKLVLGYAVRSATLTRNVASVHAAPAVEVQEIETLTAEQITAALTKLEGHMLHPIVSLALATAYAGVKFAAFNGATLISIAPYCASNALSRKLAPACGSSRQRRSVAGEMSPCQRRR
jgi:integrase